MQDVIVTMYLKFIVNRGLSTADEAQKRETTLLQVIRMMRLMRYVQS